MSKSTGKFFGENFVKGWKYSFNFNGKTNYADYSSFLIQNFIILILFVLLLWFVAKLKGFIILFSYLVANLFPMTALAIRRLNDAGLHPQYLFGIFGFYGGWWKLRERLATPSFGEYDPCEGMGKAEKIISDTFLWGAPEIAGVLISVCFAGLFGAFSLFGVMFSGN